MPDRQEFVRKKNEETDLNREAIMQRLARMDPGRQIDHRIQIVPRIL